VRWNANLVEVKFGIGLIIEVVRWNEGKRFPKNVIANQVVGSRVIRASKTINTRIDDKFLMHTLVYLEHCILLQVYIGLPFWKLLPPRIEYLCCVFCVNFYARYDSHPGGMGSFPVSVAQTLLIYGAIPQ
jgi:hypothetical protein